MSTITYQAGDELPALALSWTDTDGATIDFSTGWTFTLKLVAPDGTVALEKTTGITGAATLPNVTVAWAADDLALTAGNYYLHLTANLTASNFDRTWKPEPRDRIKITAAAS